MEAYLRCRKYDQAEKYFDILLNQKKPIENPKKLFLTLKNSNLYMEKNSRESLRKKTEALYNK